MANWFTNNFFGHTVNNDDLGVYSTPMGQNVIPSGTLTKGQKTFSTNEVLPNLPKPKTLYFVHFNLNSELENKLENKKAFINQITGQSDLMTASTIYESFSSKKKDESSDKKYNKLVTADNELTRNTLTDYIPTREILKKLSFEISKLVKEYTKPSPTFKTTELNEYNRKRHIYSGIEYNDVTISFFDVKENPVQQFFGTYLKFISGDFLCKDKYIWERPIDNNHFQNMKGYTTVDGDNIGGTYNGNLNTFGFNIESHFKLIDSISFCEYYMNKMTVYTIENPIITKIEWGNSKMGDFDSNEIKVTFKYDGITNDLIDIEPNTVDIDKWNKVNTVPYVKSMINREIKSGVATFLQTKYENLGSSLLSDAVNIMKGYMNGDTKPSWNTIKNQIADTTRKYGFASETNTLLQLEQTINDYNSKDGDDKWKYLVNVGTDSTSLIGKFTGTFNSTSSTGNIII